MDIPEIISFGYEFCPADKETTKTISYYHMLHFIIDGKGYFNGRQLHAGQGFICQELKRVCYYPDKTDPWVYAWINFRDKAVYDEISRTISFDTDGVFEFDTDKPYFSLISDVKSSQHYLNYSRNMSYCGAALYLNLMSFLKQDSHRNIGKGVDSIRKIHIEKAKQIIDFRCNYPDFTVLSLATEMHLSRAYLRNLFSMYLGMSPQQYIMQVRMERAKELLINVSAPIGIIANSVGYNDALLFSKRFCRYFGVSPRAFRNQYSCCQGIDDVQK